MAWQGLSCEPLLFAREFGKQLVTLTRVPYLV
jgi:hypothetical protein